ncbi:hypothetical protein J7L67_05570 [bacterium]|nr:hypothetical protein [bacterium]
MQSKKFTALRKKCVQYIEKQTETKNHYVVARYSNNSQAFLLSTCFAVLSLSLMNKKEQIPQYIDYILDCQQETGYFYDPAFKEEDILSNHDKSYLILQFSYFSMLALSSAGIKPKYSLYFLKPFHSPDYLRKWLESLDWSRPWLESNNVMFISCLLAQDRSFLKSQEAMEVFFQTLDEKQNMNTGLWGTDEKAIFEGVAGAYHFLIPYYFYKRYILYKEKIIDSSLSLFSFDYLYSEDGGGGACEDLDAIDIICKLTNRSEYRRNDIEDVLNKSLIALMCCQNMDGGFSYRFNPLSVNIGAVPMFDRVTWKVYLSNIINYLKKRWHYNSTWYFSGWKKMPFPLHQSDMWATYARLVSIATISHILKIEEDWDFLKVPGIGWE